MVLLSSIAQGYSTMLARAAELLYVLHVTERLHNILVRLRADTLINNRQLVQGVLELCYL